MLLALTMGSNRIFDVVRGVHRANALRAVLEICQSKVFEVEKVVLQYAKTV